MSYIFYSAVYILLFCFIVIIYARISYKFLKNFLAKEKSFNATLVDNHDNSYIKYSNRDIHRNITVYVLVFDIEGKIKSYKVSSWLYNSINKGEKTVITVKGSKLISLK